MAWNRTKIAFLAVPFLFLLSCGTDPRAYNDHGGGSLFSIDSMTPKGTFNIYEPFDDFGCDGVKASATTLPDLPEEGNGWPDPCEGAYIMTDQMDIVFSSTPRPGNTDAPALQLLYIDVSYRDNNGNARDFAPARRFYLGGTIPSLGKLTIAGAAIDDHAFKWGLFDALSNATTTEEWQALMTWDFIVTATAREQLSGEIYIAEAAITVNMNQPSANAN